MLNMGLKFESFQPFLAWKQKEKQYIDLNQALHNAAFHLGLHRLIGNSNMCLTTYNGQSRLYRIRWNILSV